MRRDLREFITTEEMKAFEDRVDEYGSKEFGGRTVSGYHLLRFWESAKSEYLFKMFGGEKLILSKNIVFMKDVSQLYQEMSHMMDEDKFFCNEWVPVQGKYWREYVSIDFDRSTNAGMICEVMNILMRPVSLTDNVYSEQTVMIKTPEGKELKIQQGCKVMRAIGKIAAAFNMDMELFEQFRIKVSQVLNQRKLSGELCISIHPLDYSTMSDNNSDWASCMSWSDYGCYRQGTVEMMNSPMVVVAYLNSADPMKLGTGLNWSNKKWRELFIVNREIITNIKSYPYHNQNLSKVVLSWLKELVDTNLKDEGFDFYPQEVEYEPYHNVGVQYSSIEVRPECNFMYNDFGNDPYANWAYFTKSFIKEEAGEIQYHDLDFNYSGESECLGCGETCDFYDNEGGLMGECCDAYYTCDYCGGTFEDDYDLEEVDGQMLCPCCLEEYCSEDAITGDLHITRNMIEVHLFSKKDPTKEIGTPFMVYNINNLATSGRYFSHIHKYDYINRYLPEDYFVYVEDATEEGLALFDLEDAENIENNYSCDAVTSHAEVVNVRECKDLAQFKYGDYQIDNYRTLYPRTASQVYLSEAVLSTVATSELEGAVQF